MPEVRARLAGGSLSVSLTSRSFLRSAASMRWLRSLEVTSSKRCASASRRKKNCSRHESGRSSPFRASCSTSKGYVLKHKRSHRSDVFSCRYGDECSRRSRVSAEQHSRTGLIRSYRMSSPRQLNASACDERTRWQYVPRVGIRRGWPSDSGNMGNVYVWPGLEREVVDCSGDERGQGSIAGTL